MKLCRTNSTCSTSTSNTTITSSTLSMMTTPTMCSTSSSSCSDDYDHQIHTLQVPYDDVANDDNDGDGDAAETQQEQEHHQPRHRQQSQQVVVHKNDDTQYTSTYATPPPPKRSSQLLNAIPSNHSNEVSGTSLFGSNSSRFDHNDNHCDIKAITKQQQQQQHVHDTHHPHPYPLQQQQQQQQQPSSSSYRFGNRILQTIQKHQQNIRYRRRRHLAEYEAAILQKNNYDNTNHINSGSDSNHNVNNHKHRIQHDSKRWKYIIPADHPLKLVWDFCTVIVSCIHGYKTHTSIRDRTFDIPYTNTIQICIEIWFIIDILLNFITEHRLGNIPLRTISAISARYLTTWFVIDILSLIPGEWLFVRPVIQRLKQRGRIQKLLSRYKAITRVTTKLIHRWTMIRQVSVVYRRQMGIGGVARLIRVLIRYIPKYILFLRNMKAVVAVRILRQWHWMRKVYYNIFVAIDVVYHNNNNNNSSSKSVISNYTNESRTITDTTPNPSLSHGNSNSSNINHSLRQTIQASPVIKSIHSNGNIVSTLNINDPISVVGLVLPMNNTNSNNHSNSNHDMVNPKSNETTRMNAAVLNDSMIHKSDDIDDITNEMDDHSNSYIADDEFLQHSRVVLFHDNDDDRHTNLNDSFVDNNGNGDEEEEEEEEGSYYFDEEDDDDDDDDGPY
jgi:hypothetical protein